MPKKKKKEVVEEKTKEKLQILKSTCKRKSKLESAKKNISKAEPPIKKVDVFQNSLENNEEEGSLEKKIPSKISLTPEKQEEIRKFFFKVFADVREQPQTQKNQTKKPNTCPHCGGKIIIDSTSGEEFCEKCGRVFDISINTSQEWRAFDFDQLISRTRAQASKSIHHADGIGSMVGQGSVDIKAVPSYKQKEYYRLRNWQMRVITTIERNLQMAYGELLRMQQYFNLPFYITEEIKLLYKELVVEKVVRGRAREQILGALLYIVMRKHKTPLTFSEIANYFGIDKKKISTVYKLIFQTIGFRVSFAKTEEYFDRFAELAGLNAKSRARLDELYKLIKSKKNTNMTNPIVDAAALVLIVAYEQNPKVNLDAFLNLNCDEITLANLKKSASLFVKEFKLNRKVLDLFKNK